MTNQDPHSEPTRPLASDGQDWFWSRPQGEEPTQYIPASDATQQMPRVDSEPTQQVPRVDSEPTQQVPRADAQQEAWSAQGQQAPAGQASGQQAYMGQQPYADQQAYAGPQTYATSTGQGGWEPPQGPASPGFAPVPSRPAPKRRRSAGIAALVGVGTLTAVAAIAGPSLVQSQGTTQSGTAPVSAPAQSGSSNSGSSNSGSSNSGSSNSGSSNSGSSNSGSSSQSGSNSGSSNQGTSGGWNQDGSQDQQGTSPAEQQPYDPWGQNQQGSGATNEQSGTTSTQQTTATASQSTGVVLITTKTASGEAAGTGMVLTSNGYVLTNYHVVQSSTSVQVEVASTKKTYTATVVGHDATNDVALLKISGASSLQTVKIDTDQLSSGAAVTAVGNSEGQGYLSAAKGTVTSLSASITVTDESAASGQEQLSNVIKTTAGAVPGDSGGPLYDAQGEVVGITTAGEQTSNSPTTQSATVASYAVPISRAMTIVDQIEAGTESGTVKVGPNAYLGISVQTENDGSLVVAQVVSGGPAAKAGVTTGSQITGIGGTSVTSHAQLSAALATHNPGDKVQLTWTDAQGTSHSATVTLGSSPVN